MRRHCPSGSAPLGQCRRMLVRRLVLFLPGVWFVASIVFIVLRVIPGDPAATIVGENAPLEVIEAMRVRLGLDQPLWQQYATFLWDLARGDLCTSLVSN